VVTNGADPVGSDSLLEHRDVERAWVDSGEAPLEPHPDVLAHRDAGGEREIGDLSGDFLHREVNLEQHALGGARDPHRAPVDAVRDLTAEGAKLDRGAEIVGRLGDRGQLVAVAGQQPDVTAERDQPALLIDLPHLDRRGDVVRLRIDPDDRARGGAGPDRVGGHAETLANRRLVDVGIDRRLDLARG
jgi:hypothetical protein